MNKTQAKTIINQSLKDCGLKKSQIFDLFWNPENIGMLNERLQEHGIQLWIADKGDGQELFCERIENGDATIIDFDAADFSYLYEDYVHMLCRLTCEFI